MSLPLHPGRVIRAGIAAALVHDSRQRVPVDCDGSGWQFRRSCADTGGRVCCPLCGRRVATIPAGRRSVVLARHQPGRSA